MSFEKPVILSLYPNMRGLGYVCLEYPKTLIDYGIATVRPIDNDRVFDRVRQCIDFFNPAIVILRDCGVAPKNKRTRLLLDLIATYAAEKEIPVHKYTRKQIRDVFEQFGATSKYQIAHVLVKEFDELASIAPKLREDWMEEEYSMGVFDALSLVTTHKYLTE